MVAAPSPRESPRESAIGITYAVIISQQLKDNLK
jgi:hypothetical protein